MNKLLMILAIFMSFITKAQNLMLAGKITYEKRFNVHKSIQEQIDKSTDEGSKTWYKHSLKVTPKFKVDLFKLSFTRKKSLYTTELEDENERLRWYKTVTDLTHYTDFIADTCKANRTIYDEKYLIADSISKPTWKYWDEYREIAGITCRKATTILNDSVYVIAFYTESIPISGGPDLYAGLPGLILGVVLPRLHITIFATKIETVVPTDEELKFIAYKKAKPFTRKGYGDDLSKNLERWGDYGNQFVLKALF